MFKVKIDVKLWTSGLYLMLSTQSLCKEKLGPWGVLTSISSILSRLYSFFLRRGEGTKYIPQARIPIGLVHDDSYDTSGYNASP